MSVSSVLAQEKPLKTLEVRAVPLPKAPGMLAKKPQTGLAQLPNMLGTGLRRGRHWVADRAQDFVKQIDFSTNEFIADSASILIGYGICATATAAATAVGTPVAGAAAASTCFASDAVSVGGTTMDIFDKENSLWPDSLPH